MFRGKRWDRGFPRVELSRVGDYVWFEFPGQGAGRTREEIARRVASALARATLGRIPATLKRAQPAKCSTRWDRRGPLPFVWSDLNTELDDTSKRRLLSLMRKHRRGAAETLSHALGILKGRSATA